MEPRIQGAAFVILLGFGQALAEGVERLLEQPGHGLHWPAVAMIVFVGAVWRLSNASRSR